ncbi:MAG: lipocalin family protein [candidate division KSB1 bacterium]|nr:lipocalin family protein [candidate division KSB1 bacterium]MDQ7065077.1 lipocalin family protein [candidate division KSB1 bacterium]
MQISSGTLLWLILAASLSAQELQFPRDDGKHDGVDFEGWTLLTHLTAEDSSRFGVAVFFLSGKVAGFKASAVYAVVADESRKTATTYRKIKPPLISRAKHTKGRLYEKYGKNVLERDPAGGPYKFELNIKDLILSLAFTPAKMPIDLGQVAVGAGKYVRLYLIPRGTVLAVMRRGHQQHVLSGFGIFQHEWGDSPEKNAASDMFAIHFQDGSDVVVYHSQTFPAINTLVRSAPNGDILLTHKFRAWADTVLASPMGSGKLAMYWRIAADEEDDLIMLKPTFDGQEIRLLGMPYWLGRCEAVRDNVNMRGVGYVYLRLKRK